MEKLQDKGGSDNRNTLNLFFTYLKLNKLPQEESNSTNPDLGESPFQEYYNLGGFFDIKSLEKAAKNYSKMTQITEESIRWVGQGDNWPVNICSLYQAESMASHSKLDINLDQKKIYIALRDAVTDCSDGEIFSQMLLLTSPKDYSQFKDSYPESFLPKFVPRENEVV